jgi:UDPglucose 6-dehydrogenase
MTSPTRRVPVDHPMTICVVGAGYVGLTAAACFAALGHEVRCVETNIGRLATLRSGGMPIFEPGLAELVTDGLRSGRLSFTSDMVVAAPGADVALLCVGTPPRADGHPDLRQLAAAATELARAATADIVAAVKSTVPPGTCEAIEMLASEAARSDVRVRVVSNPEFLRESHAVADFFDPDRVVIGADDAPAGDLVARLYPPGWPVLSCDRRSAELVKYASNTFLAVKISFANEIAGLCERVGADAASVLAGVGLDTRIGPAFLTHGPGFGGSCLAKDLTGLIATAAAVSYPTPLAAAAHNVNLAARARVVTKLETTLGPLAGKRIAVLGLAFKAGTDDTRYSPAVTIVDQLNAVGAEVSAYDPMADTANLAARGADDPYDAAGGADALIIATAWPQFARLDLARLASVMAGRVILDAVGALDAATTEAAGFELVGLGRGTPDTFHAVVVPPLEWALDVVMA